MYTFIEYIGVSSSKDIYVITVKTAAADLPTWYNSIVFHVSTNAECLDVEPKGFMAGGGVSVGGSVSVSVPHSLCTSSGVGTNSSSVVIGSLLPTGGCGYTSKWAIALEATFEWSVTTVCSFINVGNILLPWFMRYVWMDAATWTPSLLVTSPAPMIATRGQTNIMTAAFNASMSQGGFDGDDATAITEYLWDFGDGSRYTGAESSVDHTYEKAGKYTINLAVYAPPVNWSSSAYDPFSSSSAIIEVVDPNATIDAYIYIENYVGSTLVSTYVEGIGYDTYAFGGYAAYPCDICLLAYLHDSNFSSIPGAAVDFAFWDTDGYLHTSTETTNENGTAAVLVSPAPDASAGLCAFQATYGANNDTLAFGYEACLLARGHAIYSDIYIDSVYLYLRGTTVGTEVTLDPDWRLECWMLDFWLSAAPANPIYVTLNTDCMLVAVCMLRYDVDSNRVVNMLDTFLVAEAFGRTGSPGWIPEDVDDNGVVNMLDLYQTALHFGQTA